MDSSETMPTHTCQSMRSFWMVGQRMSFGKLEKQAEFKNIFHKNDIAASGAVEDIFPVFKK